MNKIVSTLFIILLSIGCNGNLDTEKIVYIDKCKSGDTSREMEHFCKCCYIQLLNHEEMSPNFINAIRDNCMSLLY